MFSLDNLTTLRQDYSPLMRQHSHMNMQSETGCACHLPAKILQVVPVYCFDPRHYVTTPWGNPKTGNFRAKFLLESVLDLKESLRRVDSDLIIKYGQPEDILPGLLGNGPAKVLTQEEFAFEELGTMAKVGCLTMSLKCLVCRSISVCTTSHVSMARAVSAI